MDNLGKVGASDLPLRPKWWSELSADEKIERLREQIGMQARLINSLERRLSELYSHVHIENRLYFGNSRPGLEVGYGHTLSPPNPDNVYF